jgi:hypothetical protein
MKLDCDKCNRSVAILLYCVLDKVGQDEIIIYGDKMLEIEKHNSIVSAEETRDGNFRISKGGINIGRQTRYSLV